VRLRSFIALAVASGPLACIGGSCMKLHHLLQKCSFFLIKLAAFQASGAAYIWFEIPIIAALYNLVCRMALDRIENLLSESANLTA
jgi:hypothetical protein